MVGIPLKQLHWIASDFQLNVEVGLATVSTRVLQKNLTQSLVDVLGKKTERINYLCNECEKEAKLAHYQKGAEQYAALKKKSGSRSVKTRSNRGF